MKFVLLGHACFRDFYIHSINPSLTIVTRGWTLNRAIGKRKSVTHRRAFAQVHYLISFQKKGKKHSTTAEREFQRRERTMRKMSEYQRRTVINRERFLLSASLRFRLSNRQPEQETNPRKEMHRKMSGMNIRALSGYNKKQHCYIR